MEFQCQASGDPAPTIIWKREEGQIPQGRYAKLSYFCYLVSTGQAKEKMAKDILCQEKLIEFGKLFFTQVVVC